MSKKSKKPAASPKEKVIPSEFITAKFEDSIKVVRDIIPVSDKMNRRKRQDVEIYEDLRVIVDDADRKIARLIKDKVPKEGLKWREDQEEFCASVEDVVKNARQAIRQATSQKNLDKGGIQQSRSTQVRIEDREVDIRAAHVSGLERTCRDWMVRGHPTPGNVNVTHAADGHRCRAFVVRIAAEVGSVQQIACATAGRV